MSETTIATPTPHELSSRALLKALADAGGNIQREDDLIFEGTKIVLPKTMDGNIQQAIAFLQDHIKQQQAPHTFDRTFRYRPFDGAHAFQEVLKKLWGTTGHGVPFMTMWGPVPPGFTTIEIGVNETAQVPRGQVRLDALEADVLIGGTMDPELGPLFRLTIEAPRKYRSHIEGLFNAVQAELEAFSIYKGKAITGADIPTFVDTSKVDVNQVIYSEDLMLQLEANIWSVLRYSGTLRDLGVSRKRAVLLEGDYGTGKTLAAYLTAKVAEEAGWTFLLCRPGQDNLGATMQTALLYAPSVVFFEDIDVVAEGDNPQSVSELLDAFDGVSAKGQDCVAILTTNHVEKIHKGMLRPGRLDAVLHFDALDKSGVEKLVRAKIPSEHLGSLDMDLVYDAFKGMLPAFVAEGCDRSLRYAMARNEGKPGIIESQDLIAAAHGLRPQLDLMQEAKLGKHREPLDVAFTRLVRDASDGLVLTDDPDGRGYYRVSATSDAE